MQATTYDLLPSQRAELRELAPRKQAKVRVSWPDPIVFAEKVCGMKPNKRQKELNLPWYTSQMLEAFISIVENKNTMMLSGNMIGKTLILAIVALWLFYREREIGGVVYPGMTVVTIATRGEQVKTLWAKIRSLRNKAKREMGIELPGDWAPKDMQVTDVSDPEHRLFGTAPAVAAGEEVATSLSGIHYPGGMVVIGDECIGIKKAVLESADRLCGDPTDRKILAGNPTDEGAYAHEMEAMTRLDGKTPMWSVLHFSSEDHPNVKHGEIIIPGCATTEFCQEQEAKGGGRDSAFYRTSVLGQWPGDKQDALIQTSWINNAIEKSEMRAEIDAYEREHPDLPKRSIDQRGVALGLDVAGEGKDLTVLMGISDWKLFYPKLSVPCFHHGKDTDHAVELLMRAIKEIPRVLSISIDDGGLGATVANEMWKRRAECPTIPIYVTKGPLASPSSINGKCSVTRVNFGGSPLNDFDKTQLRLMRDVLWWKFREMLRLGKLLLPTDAEGRNVGFPPGVSLRAQIMAPLLYLDDTGKLIVFDKRSAGGGRYKERTKSLPDISPDVAHASILACHAYSQLPERQTAPQTVQEHHETRIRAEIEATKQRFQAGATRHQHRSPVLRRVTS